MKNLVRSIVIAGCLALLLHAPTAGATEPPPALPANLAAPKQLKRLLEKMWARSPKFRRQCARIAATPDLFVALKTGSRTEPSKSYRAITDIVKRPDGVIVASVRIVNRSSLVELIGHEFEHIVEHLEGLDLPSAAATRNAAVRRTTDGFFETHRAIEAGRQVDREYRKAKGSRSLPIHDRDVAIEG